MSRRKLRMKYRRFLKYYDFDLKIIDSKQAADVLTLLQEAKHQQITA